MTSIRAAPFGYSIQPSALRDASGLKGSPESPNMGDFDAPPLPRSSYSIDSAKALTTRESVELFQDSVETARQGIQKSLAGSGPAVETLRPKLTVDLNRRNLQQIPAEVVSIIRHDVERLQLAHNQLRSIAPEFSTCLVLKYLNLRDNRFHDIPPAIFGLPQLEILDLSRNQLREVPPEIVNLRALRVFSIHHNAIEDLPSCLGNISTLRVLKLTENPFQPALQEVIDSLDKTLSSTAQVPPEENERERLVTIRVREYLRQKLDAGEPLETPRALSRFPIYPQDAGYLTSGSESAPPPRSPSILRSSRTHSRAPSSQLNTMHSNGVRRPGLAPLTLTTERLRSNSELLPLSSQSARSKRMGMVTRKSGDLDLHDEEHHRNSFHLRGQSHSSALRHMHESQDVKTTSPTALDRGTFVRRLSSVPEQRQAMVSQDSAVEAAKGILYSLHMVQPYLISLVALVREQEPKRSSLDKYRFQAAVQLSHLDQSVVDFEAAEQRNPRVRRDCRRTMCRATHASLVLYGNIANLLLQNAKQLIVDGDPRYIRTLMLLLYGSMNEGRNARRKLAGNKGLTLRSAPRRSPAKREAITPTQQKPRVDSRWRGESATVRPSLDIALQRSYSSASGRGLSRSNSRAGYPESVASTPRSGESFGASYLVSRSRSGSSALNPDRARQAQFEQDQFEKIYILLNKAADQGSQVIPYLEPRFLDNFERANKSFAPIEVRRLWSTIVTRTRLCGDRSERLKERLQEIHINDPHARNAADFWKLAMLFVDAYGNLLASLREARTLTQIDSDLRYRLRPIHKVTLEAGTLIKNSPWNRLTSDSQPPSTSHSRAPTPVQSDFHLPTHRRADGSNESNAAYTVNVPPTPLSAALGPAAQATVPNTPATGTSMAGVFEGNVFQRADNLLLQGQTMVYRRA